MNSPTSTIDKAVASLKKSLHGLKIDSGLVLGSGLGELIEQFTLIERIPYSEIAEFPVSTAPSHHGQLVIAQHTDKQGKTHTLAIFQGRFHLYEGYTAQQVSMPIYLLKKLGAKRVIITNAAGALNPHMAVASIMQIDDHINFTGRNPLIGRNDEDLGARFSDMSQAYCPQLRNLAQQCAKNTGITLNSGIYAGVLGPSFETSAERRYLRQAGCDAVGMSTVTEVIAANHCQLPVLAFCAITNGATGLKDQQPDTVENALANAKIASNKLAQLIPEVVKGVST